MSCMENSGLTEKKTQVKITITVYDKTLLKYDILLIYEPMQEHTLLTLY